MADESTGGLEFGGETNGPHLSHNSLADALGQPHAQPADANAPLPDALPPQPAPPMTIESVADFNTMPDAPRMNIDDVANFETFPTAPAAPAAPAAPTTPPAASAPPTASAPSSSHNTVSLENSTAEQWAELDRITEEMAGRGPMTPENVHNFETFPTAPKETAPGRPVQGGGTPSSDTSPSPVLGFTFQDDGFGNGPPAPTGPMTIDTVHNFQTFPTADDYEARQRAEEQFQRDLQDAELETVASSTRPSGGGGMPRAGLFAVGGAVVLLGLGLVAMLVRGGGVPATPPAPGTTAATQAASGPAGAAPAKAATGGKVWIGCTGPVVTAAQRDAIPSNQRWYVAVWCIGDHYYPAEQFTFRLVAACEQAGLIGGSTVLITRSGGPAVALDDPNFTLPPVQPCGYMRFDEVNAHNEAIRQRIPPSDGSSPQDSMYPAATATYRAFQAKAGLGGAR